MRNAALCVGLTLSVLVASSPRASADGTPPIPSSQMQQPGPATPLPAPSGMQYLYGSGEGAAITRTVWRALVDYVKLHKADRKSVVLRPDSTLAAPQTTDCMKGQPLAAVFDVDETVLLNAGAEYDAAKGEPFSRMRWQQWEVFGVDRPIASPGAVDALQALRGMGLKVIFSSNRLAIHAKENSESIEHAGLGPAVYFADDTHWQEQTLYLADSMDPADTAKDARRARIANHYCVIAMGGDQLGDFSDLFNPPVKLEPQARRAATEGAPRIADLWGNGWFTFPNPVYGSAMAGSVDQVFPDAVKWPSNDHPHQ